MAERFIDHALQSFGDTDPKKGSLHDRGSRLAYLIRKERTLLVLDGIEPLQYPPGRPEIAGRLKEPGLAALLKGLAAGNPGLCVVATRERIADLAGSPGTAPQVDLEDLELEAAVALLLRLGVKGRESELPVAAEEFQRHALTLTLLGNFLHRAHGGDVRKRREIDLHRADEKQGRHAFRVIAAYTRWLGEGPELAILRLLGLFDRPAEAMQPLFAAVVHGCRAGRQQEAWTDVYRRRIQRGDEFYSTKKLGAFGSDLTALAGFFESPWSRPSAHLTAAAQSFALNGAAFRLRALGRLTEAVEPMQAGLEARISQEDWNNAAISASNLSELTLTLGDVARAVAFGEQSVELADRNGDAFQRMGKRATWADVLHQSGRWEESAAAFREAEAMQAEWRPEYPWLFSLRGFQYCDLLLGRAEPAAGSGAWADWIAWTLEEAGYRVVYQPWDFRPGGNFVLEMQKAAQEARRTVIVLTDNYLQAEYTQPEWAAAFVEDPRGEDRKLIPLRVAPCSPAGLLKPLIYADLVGLPPDAARASVLTAVAADRPKPAQPPAFPGTVPPPASPAPAFPGSPPPARSSASPASRALALWSEKLAFLEEQEAIAVEANQRFALKKQIEEARAKVREHGGGSA